MTDETHPRDWTPEYTEEMLSRLDTSPIDLLNQSYAEYQQTDEFKRYEARIEVARRTVGWTRHIPLIGQLLWVFYGGLIEEGVQETLKPRWGAMTFCFLNDGMKPTIWHTVLSVIASPGRDPGIYPSGAPTFREWWKERHA